MQEERRNVEKERERVRIGEMRWECAAGNGIARHLRRIFEKKTIRATTVMYIVM